MKKYSYILLFLATLSACNELDKYPQDAVSSQTFFQTEEQLEQYTNQFYSILPSASSMYEEVSDEVATVLLPDEVRGSRLIPADASSSSWTWGALRHINYCLAHINQCEDKNAANQYAGLARFFRAYFYYDKIRRFGDVPWFDKPLDNNDEALYNPRDHRWIVMQHVVEDLDFAIANMTADKSNVFQVNRFAAMALKSRACLFEGTFCKYHRIQAPDVDGKPYWRYMLEQSASASQQLMAEGGYSLYQQGTQPYRDLFTIVDAYSCPEFILVRGYNSNLGLKHNATGYTINSTTGKPGFTKRFVNKYLNRDGSRFTDDPNYATASLGEEMEDRDPRMEQTMLRPFHYIRIGKTKVDDYYYDITTSSTGYQLIKYVMGDEYNTYGNSENDMPIFRLAEIYLNLAEAKAELGEFDQILADKTINLLRDRAGMNTGHLNVATAIANPCPYMQSLYPCVEGANAGVILEIRRERDIELVLEGHRYWDLMRWKEGQSFTQPYLGVYFKGVSRPGHEEDGFMDIDNDGYDDICVWVTEAPFMFGIDFYELNKDFILTKGIEGGYILNNGTPENLNNGRTWNEERDYLYPIPVRERVLSNGKLSQNPGWNDGLVFNN